MTSKGTPNARLYHGFHSSKASLNGVSSEFYDH
jgi:hypothetical protein